MEEKKTFRPHRGDFVSWNPENGPITAVAALCDPDYYDIAMGAQMDSNASGPEDLWWVDNLPSDEVIRPASKEDIGRFLAQLVEYGETFLIVKGKWVSLPSEINIPIDSDEP